MAISLSRWLQIVALAATGAVLAVLVFGNDRAALLTDISNDTVIATLGSTAVPYPPELRAAAVAARAAPQDRKAALEAARQYLDYGRRIGDARFAGAALGVLEPWLNGGTNPATLPDILNVAASARQYMHDFAGAIDLLDSVIANDPANAQALLSRANIYIVRGEFALAGADCAALAQARRADLAVMCDTTVKALTAEAPIAYARLERLVDANAIDPALRGYANSLLGEMARFQEHPEAAREKFAAARASDPDDLRTLMILVDLELAQSRAADGLQLMTDAPSTDSIMVRQAVAHKAMGDEGEVNRLAGMLRGRFEAAEAAGEATHAREAARYWLEVEEDAEAAVEAAAVNWGEQRELEDALLLMEAAVAARRPEAAAAVVVWAEGEGVVAPMYLSALRKWEEASK